MTQHTKDDELMLTFKGTLECFICQKGVIDKRVAQINRVVTIYLCAGCITRLNNAILHDDLPHSVIDIDTTPEHSGD